MGNKTDFWDQRSVHYDEQIRRHAKGFLRTVARTREYLDPNQEVLDLGCASGEYSIQLADNARKITGIDPSAQMISLAEAKLKPEHSGKLTFIQTDIMDARFEPDTFDSILAFSVLHLIEDVPAALRRAHLLLRDGGLIISQTPCLRGRSWMLRTLLHLAQRLGVAPMIHNFSPKQLESLFEKNGFELLESELWNAKDGVQWILARRR